VHDKIFDHMPQGSLIPTGLVAQTLDDVFGVLKVNEWFHTIHSDYFGEWVICTTYASSRKRGR
jgi:hypothetical protein